MSSILSDDGMNLLFRQARTFYSWSNSTVSENVLHQLYDLMKWGPTSMNSSPMRVLFLRTPESKQRLLPALAKGNIDKTMSAPVTAIIANDLKFYEKLPRLAPQVKGSREMFAGKKDAIDSLVMRNGSLQGAYFIIAARALGLDCGPMSGFDQEKVDEEFFSGKNPGDIIDSESEIKTNFLCNLGYGNAEKNYPRAPRLEFNEACRII